LESSSYIPLSSAGSNSLNINLSVSIKISI
jgi:hypothetical protein